MYLARIRLREIGVLWVCCGCALGMLWVYCGYAVGDTVL